MFFNASCYHSSILRESDGNPVVAVLGDLLSDVELDGVVRGGLPGGFVLAAVLAALARETPGVDASAGSFLL